jgi:hypothetical protein
VMITIFFLSKIPFSYLVSSKAKDFSLIMISRV